MSRGVWQAVEASTGKIRMGEAEGRGSEGRSREEERRERQKEEAEKGEDSRSKESSRGMGDMGRGRRSSKIRRGSKETSTGKVP